MALTYRFYRSPRIGTGASRADAFRADLTRFVVGDGSGTDFWDWVNDARSVRYCLASCDSAVHAQIDADGTSTALSPELADLPAVGNWLDNQTALNLPQAIQTLLESDGISLAWLASQTTRRQLFNYASRLHVMLQDLKRLGNGTTLGALANGLDTQRQQLTAGQRSALNTWLVSKGLDSGWTTPTTTLRQFIQFVLENISWTTLTLGPVTF
jgi:hypothetical protein